MSQGWIPFAVVFAMLTNAAPADADCCSVIELRQYTLKPGQRDTLVDVFERHFIESQEAAGMTLVGQFRDRRRDDRFVWIRGFADMKIRHQALEAFYGGPVWAAHRNTANSTMLDSDDVLLLKPARPDLAFRLDGPSVKAGRPERGELAVLAGVHHMPRPVDAGTVTQFERQVAPLLRGEGITLEGVFITEYSANTFTRLPVRENTHVLVWFGTVARNRLSPAALDRLASRTATGSQPVTILDLSPTPRSRLGDGPKAARSTHHDFDFLFGSWQVHNRYLKGRFKQSTEWSEFEARSAVAPLLQGFGHLDQFTAVRDGESFEGITLRLFDPVTGEWSIHWADTKYARTLLPPMVGRFTGGVGEFYGDEFVEGKKVKCRFFWTRPTPDSAQWEQAFSDDDGKTWETNWIMRFQRDGGDASAAAIRAVWADLDAAWNARDAARFSALYVDDASFEFVDQGQVIDGRDAIRRHFEGQFPRTAAEFTHHTRIRATRRIADGVVGADGVVQIMRSPAGGGGSSVFRTFAVHAVMVRTGDMWRIDALRIFQMPG